MKKIWNNELYYNRKNYISKKKFDIYEGKSYRKKKTINILGKIFRVIWGEKKRLNRF